MGRDRRSWRIQIPSAVATNGSTSVRVAAVAAVRWRNPATYSQYARATVTGPSHAVRTRDRGPASRLSCGTSHGPRAAPPSSSVTGTTASMFTFAWMSRLADTV